MPQNHPEEKKLSLNELFFTITASLENFKGKEKGKGKTVGNKLTTNKLLQNT